MDNSRNTFSRSSEDLFPSDLFLVSEALAASQKLKTMNKLKASTPRSLGELRSEVVKNISQAPGPSQEITPWDQEWKISVTTKMENMSKKMDQMMIVLTKIEQKLEAFKPRSTPSYPTITPSAPTHATLLDLYGQNGM